MHLNRQNRQTRQVLTYKLQNISGAGRYTLSEIKIDGAYYRRSRYYLGQELGGDPGQCRCHDCGIIEGELHHIGCDCERCPVCDDQLISCECDHKWHVWDDKDFWIGK
jgi:hypothetical protein